MLGPFRGAEKYLHAEARTAVATDQPFRWLHIPQFFEEGLAARLAETYPRDGFELVHGDGYEFHARPLVAGDRQFTDGDLSDEWRDMARFFAADEYSNELARMLRVTLDNCHVVASFCEYPAGCSMIPHTDRAVRRITQTLYFNCGWRAAWGGRALILRSNSVTDVEAQVLPESNTSILFVRSKSSWHAVEKVMGPAVVRRSVLLHVMAPPS